MYCHQCGIHHPNDASNCQMCGADFSAAAAHQQESEIFINLMRFPYTTLCRSLRKTHTLLWIFVLPFFSLIYLAKKISGAPLPSLRLKSQTPKYHLVDLEQFPKLHKKNFRQAASFLEEQGFEPLADIEDVSLVQGNIEHIRIHRERRLYATLHISKQTGKVLYGAFSAYFPEDKFLLVDNVAAFPLRYPEQLHIHHLPEAPLEAVYQAFIKKLGTFAELPRLLSLREVLICGYRQRRLSVDLGIEQGIFQIKTPERAKQRSSSMCYHHPLNAAVRTCAECGKSLCEACYTEYQERYYCQDCLPDEADTAGSPAGLRESYDYAGFGVRALAALLDALVLVSVGIGFYFALSRWLPPDTLPASAPFIITQLLTISGALWYLLVPPRKYGCSLGQALFGLRIVDHRGKLPEPAAVFVRFAYLLISALFLLPLLGYLFILFRKTRQGLHDKLAGTYVITKHARRKAVIAWTILALLGGGLGRQAYRYVKEAGWPPGIPSPEDETFFQDEIFLDARWEKTFTQEHESVVSFLRRGMHTLVATSTSLQAFDTRTGDVVWNVADLPGVSLSPLSESPDLPLLGLQYREEDNVWALLEIAPENGGIRRRQRLEGMYEPHLLFDAQSILVYDNTDIYCYTRHGTLRWQQKFHDNFLLEYAVLHSDVLLGRYSDSALTLTSVDLASGAKRWEIKKSPYRPGYVVSKDRQLFYTDEGKTMLFDVAAWQPLWEAAASIGFVAQPPRRPIAQEPPPIIYTTEQAINTQDGTTHYRYPPYTRFGTLTRDTLVLYDERPEHANIRLLDKHTGELRQSLGKNTWLSIFYLLEDDSRLYLAAALQPERGGQGKVETELLIIDKQLYKMREIPVGRNIGSLQWKIFPQEHLLALSTFQRIGSYRIPVK